MNCMKRIRIGIALVLIGLVAGCAYFNTFYNAKLYYRKAYHETKKNRMRDPTNTEKTNYQNAIQKALKLIEMYPSSKYVDDALLILGKSYYYRGEYWQANRRFTELATKYPESEFALETRLWLAKTAMALEQTTDAKSRFEQLFDDALPKRIRAESHYYLGRLFERQDDFQKSIEEYEKALDIGLEEFEADIRFAIGMSYDTLGVYANAAEAFKGVLKADPLPDLRFEAEFKYAQMLKKQGLFDDAIRDFERLMVDERYKTRVPEIKLEIAESLALKGEVDDAIMAYQDLTQEHQRTRQSAKALYRLGRLYEKDRLDYQRAYDNFDKVRTEFRQSEFADSADIQKRDIQRFQALRQVVQLGLTGESGELEMQEEIVEEDTLTLDRVYAMLDASQTDSARIRILYQMAGSSFSDSLVRVIQIRQNESRLEEVRQRPVRRSRQSGMDWETWVLYGEFRDGVDVAQELMKLRESIQAREKETLVENPELKQFNVEEVDKNLFLLAELYLFRFVFPDSAVMLYRRLLDMFPESPYAPQSLYNLAYISEEIYRDSTGAGSHYRRLIEDYAQSPYARHATDRSTSTDNQLQGNPIQELILEAERLLIDQEDPWAAFQMYQEVLERYSDSNQVPKALYSMGWICENQLDSLRLAFTLYDSLLARYPETIYAKDVRQKVEAVKQNREQGGEGELKMPVKVEESEPLPQSASPDTTGSLDLPVDSAPDSALSRVTPIKSVPPDTTGSPDFKSKDVKGKKETEKNPRRSSSGILLLPI